MTTYLTSDLTQFNDFPVVQLRLNFIRTYLTVIFSDSIRDAQQ